jgi:prophage regulatory protein
MFAAMAKHLMGAQEIETRLGVSRQRVYQLTQRADWPAPYDTLAMGNVWLITDVERWISEHRPDLAQQPGTQQH